MSDFKPISHPILSATLLSSSAPPSSAVAWSKGAALLLIVALLLAGSLVGPAGPAHGEAPASLGTAPAVAADTRAPVWVTQVEGGITPTLADYLERTMERAAEDQAEALVVELDTPGGLDSAMRQIIQAEIDCPRPVVFYVYPQGARAASAGVYILMGADAAAMAPQTNLGAAQPVSLTGEMDETMKEKVVNDAAAYIRGLATRHGRNAEWAERAVRESVSLTAEEALAQNVIEFVADDLDDLLRQLDGFTVQPKGITLHTIGAPIVEVSMNWRERLLHRLVDPNVIFLLLLLGVYGLIFEFQSPRIGAAGVAGVICLLLAAYALQILPVNYVGLALIAVAMVLYVAEVKIQSYGLLGLGATIALVLGGLLLFDTPESILRVDWVVVGIAAAFSLGFFIVLVGAVARTHRRRVSTGSEGMLHDTGVTRTRLDPRGQVLVHGEIWRAEADDPPVDPGEQIEVVRMEGLLLRVRRKEDGAGPTAGQPQ